MDLDSQLKHNVKLFVAFSIAIDESMDITDVAQLAIFIHGVDETLTVTEEFLELVPVMDATTANDIFNCCRSARQGRSGLGPCCQPGYRWRAINDRDITWILQSI